MEYTQNLNTIIKYAEQEAQRLGNAQVEPEHLLLGILRMNDSKACQLLVQHGVDVLQLKHEIDQQSIRLEKVTAVALSRTSQRILRISTIEANYFKVVPDSEHLLFAILRERVNMPAMLLEHNHGVTYESLEKLYPKPVTTQNIPSDEVLNEEGLGQFTIIGGMRPSTHTEDTSILHKFTKDLTQLAQEGKLDPMIGRKNEIERIVQILGRRKKNNPVLIGDPGVGKTAIVEGIANLLAKNAITSLKGKRILSLNLAALVAGTSYRGQFEQRIQNLLKELEKHPEIIIFVDEIHTIMGAGNAQGSMDAANILKPALAHGDIQCIGSTTIEEYRKSIEKDKALERRFQKIAIKQPTKSETLAIIQQLIPLYESHHHVSYSPEAINTCIEWSERYLTDRAMPDKAIDVLDEAGAFRKQGKGSIVTKEDIAHVVSLMSGVPMQRINMKEQERLKNLGQRLKGKVIGQDEAIHSIVKAIQRSRLGLQDPNKPIGTFFFLGPTGVGKTYLAHCVSEEMFGRKDAVIRFDMTEYSEKHTVSLLVGAPPGYQAHEDGGKLTETVRQNPYSVLLFDEIEKAHPDIFNVLLPLLDEGRLTDRQGRQVDFRHTIIIFTSNVGTRKLVDFGNGIGFNTTDSNERNVTHTLSHELKKTFAPEFINRLDEIIYFQPLTKEDIARILDIEISKLQKRMQAEGYSITITTQARKQLLTTSYDFTHGARPIKRMLQTYIEDRLTDILLEHPDKKRIVLSKIL